MMPRIVVTGSLNMDLVMRSPRTPVLGETIPAGPFVTSHGGKGANQAVACARLGASVAMIGRVGDDAFGAGLRESLEREGVDASAVLTTRECSTGVASIVVVDGDNGILIAPGANGMLSPWDIRTAAPLFYGASCALFQLEIPVETVLDGLRLAKRVGVRTILNPAPFASLPDEVFALADFFIPNRIELEQFSGISGLAEGASALRSRGASGIVVTVGKEGAWIFTDAEPLLVKAPAIDAVDSTGAGDAFVAAFAVALAEEKSPRDAVEMAVCAGALACIRLGAREGLPSRAEVDDLLRENVFRTGASRR